MRKREISTTDQEKLKPPPAKRCQATSNNSPLITPTQAIPASCSKYIDFYNDTYASNPLVTIPRKGRSQPETIDSLDWLLNRALAEGSLEGNHSYIQLAFPTTIPSAYHHKDSVVTSENYHTIKSCLQQLHTDSTGTASRIEKAMHVMLTHWGINYNSTTYESTVLNSNFSKYITAHSNHNQLRFTRFMESICLFHPNGKRVIESIYNMIIKNPGYLKVNPKSREIWQTQYQKVTSETFGLTLTTEAPELRSAPLLFTTMFFASPTVPTDGDTDSSSQHSLMR